MKIAWSGLADKKYWEYIAKFCVPSWNQLLGDKYVVTDDMSLPITGVTLIDYNSIENKNSRFLAGSKKVHNFWRKMQSQVWAVKTLTDYDFVILLDTDIEAIEFNTEEFYRIIDNFKKSGLVWATGRSQRQGHDSGFIIFNMAHPDKDMLISKYENIWESGNIVNLPKAYDGDAVESLLLEHESYKVYNVDCGKGLHHYQGLNIVHWGSKEPKQLRSTANSGKDLLKEKLENLIIKKFKDV